MKFEYLVIIVMIFLVGGILALITLSIEQTQNPIVIETSKPEYEIGDEITIKIKNTGVEPLTLPNTPAGVRVHEDQNLFEITSMGSQDLVFYLGPFEETTFTVDEKLLDPGTYTIKTKMYSKDGIVEQSHSIRIVDSEKAIILTNKDPKFISEYTTLEPQGTLSQEIYFSEDRTSVLRFFYSQIIPEQSNVEPIFAEIIDPNNVIIHAIESEAPASNCSRLELPSRGSNCIFTGTLNFFTNETGTYKLQITNPQENEITVGFFLGDIVSLINEPYDEIPAELVVRFYPVSCHDFVRGCYIDWLSEYYQGLDKKSPENFPEWDLNSKRLGYNMNKEFVKDFFGKSGIDVVQVSFNNFEPADETTEGWNKYEMLMVIPSSDFEELMQLDLEKFVYYPELGIFPHH